MAVEARPRVGLASNAAVRERCVTPAALRRLQMFADFTHEAFDQPSSWDAPPPHDPEAEAALMRFAAGVDALLVCHGSPRVTDRVLQAAPRVRLVGELEGDRFAQRIDVDAASSRGVRAVDTTHGTSLGVAEWALGMALIGLRNAGSLFRRMIGGETLFADREQRTSDPSYRRGELTGRTVGLIGCGHIGRRLLELLEPFAVDVLAHDPYVPRELADVYGLTFTSLERVLTTSDVVVCLVPLTPATRGMLGAEQLALLRPGTVFVNVSRGAIVQSDALVDRLRPGDVIACLDVFDPEPVPADSPLRAMPNVFLTPHIAGVTAAGPPRLFSLMVDELERFFAGHETRHDLSPRTLANRRGQPPPA